MEFKPGVLTPAEYHQRKHSCTEEQLRRLTQSAEFAAAFAAKRSPPRQLVSADRRRYFTILVAAVLLLSSVGTLLCLATHKVRAHLWHD